MWDATWKLVGLSCRKGLLLGTLEQLLPPALSLTRTAVGDSGNYNSQQAEACQDAPAPLGSTFQSNPPGYVALACVSVTLGGD